MKRFADFNLRVPLNNTSQTERMVNNAHELGYNLVATPLPLYVRQEQISHIRNIFREVNIDFATRVNFSPRTPNELLCSLRRFRRKFEIISVLCHTKDIARQAAKDRRVDLLQFSATNPRKRFFDKAEAELASQTFASFEIEIAPLLQLAGASRIRLFSSLQKEVALAEKFKVPVTISSGAKNEYQMRGPRDCAAFTTLFDLSQSSALKALSENPFTIVERNREKLSPEYVAPGIRFVGRRDVA